jgi:hypothetical protein
MYCWIETNVLIISEPVHLTGPGPIAVDFVPRGFSRQGNMNITGRAMVFAIRMSSPSSIEATVGPVETITSTRTLASEEMNRNPNCSQNPKGSDGILWIHCQLLQKLSNPCSRVRFLRWVTDRRCGEEGKRRRSRSDPTTKGYQSRFRSRTFRA